MEEKEHKDHKNDHDDHKDNTGLIIGIIVIAMLLIGLLGYLMMNGKDEVKDVIDKTGDTIEKVTDNDEKTMNDVAGSYQAKYKLNNDELDDAEDTEEYIELVLKEDGTAKIVMTSVSNNELIGTYTVANKRITVMTNNSTTNDNETNITTSNMAGTYEFMINDDDTLSYSGDNNEVTLTKTNKDNLKYIK